MKQTALQYYLGKKGNCAQAVTYALSLKGLASSECIPEMRAYGGGRAPEKMCGALFAAVRVAPNSEMAQQIQDHFAEASGGVLACPQVRAAGRLKCADCVATAAELAEKIYPTNAS